MEDRYCALAKMWNATAADDPAKAGNPAAVRATLANSHLDEAVLAKLNAELK